ncbi:MAG: beta-galactosidase [Planctomycetota bacterium]
MRARGCQYARVNIPWEDVEPQPGTYDWRIPDEILAMAEEEKLQLQLWMFPTTRGSGLGDGGVPWWSLKEPAIDRHGKPGFFPSIWSPFYRTHYFGMLEAMTKRYAEHPRVLNFIYDFGNSDFPYGYYYYGGDNKIFDYSPHERTAFAAYLRDELGWSLATVGRLFARDFQSFNDVPVPYSEEKDAFGVYVQFRMWSIDVGVRHVNNIVRQFAPSKLPSDPPGHGAGSIADVSTYFLEAKAKHWIEERKFDPTAVYAHSAPLHSVRWGGEAWQVGAMYRQYDDALFQSVRLNASYNTIPGPDLGVYGEDIARMGFIRRELMGAVRAAPELAVFDRMAWKSRSLANIATCLDFPVDLICDKHRYDFSCYKLMTLPDNDFFGREGSQSLPSDEPWYWLLRESIEKGLNLLVFPKTCEILGAGRVQRTFLRQVLGLEDVRYGDRTKRTIKFPASFGGGTMRGNASEVIGDGEPLLTDTRGKPVLIRRPLGKGAVLLAGYDINADDAIDEFRDFESHERMTNHTLMRLCRHLGIRGKDYQTDDLFAWKELIRKGSKEYFLLFSHLRTRMKADVRVRLAMSARSAIDLATGRRIPTKRLMNGWHRLSLELQPWSGMYLAFEA